MGLSSGQILPRATDVIRARKQLGPARARVAAGPDGEVAGLGFGSGLNVAYYPPAVHRARVVDPATLGRKLAAMRLAAAPVEIADLDGRQLPDSQRVDHVLATWTLCSIPGPGVPGPRSTGCCSPAAGSASPNTAAPRPEGGPLAGPAHPEPSPWRMHAVDALTFRRQQLARNMATTLARLKTAIESQPSR